MTDGVTLVRESGIVSAAGAQGFAVALPDESFLKYDLCSFRDEMRKARGAHPNDPDVEKNLMVDAYRKMGDALKATGRPILYSVCQYGVDEPWKWGPEVGANMWRTTDDIDDSYGRMIAIGFSQAGLSKFAGPGHWRHTTHPRQISPRNRERRANQTEPRDLLHWGRHEPRPCLSPGDACSSRLAMKAPVPSRSAAVGLDLQDARSARDSGRSRAGSSGRELL